MLSRAISLIRLRAYERECRKQATDSPDTDTRVEFAKMATTFAKVAEDLESNNRRS
jgi:hypothetical protein